MGLCFTPRELQKDISYMQNWVCMNEILILKVEYLRIKVNKRSMYENKSHIDGKNILKWVYKFECKMGLKTYIYDFSQTFNF